MIETSTLEVAERADVIVRELRASDLPLADVILRLRVRHVHRRGLTVRG